MRVRPAKQNKRLGPMIALASAGGGQLAWWSCLRRPCLALLTGVLPESAAGQVDYIVDGAAWTPTTPTTVGGRGPSAGAQGLRAHADRNFGYHGPDGQVVCRPRLRPRFSIVGGFRRWVLETTQIADNAVLLRQQAGPPATTLCVNVGRRSPARVFPGFDARQARQATSTSPPIDCQPGQKKARVVVRPDPQHRRLQTSCSPATAISGRSHVPSPRSWAST